MSSREAILAAIRRNRPAPVALPDIPLFDEAQASETQEARLDRFFAAFRTMGGKVLERPPAGRDALAEIRTRVASAGIVVSRVPEIEGTDRLDLACAPADLANVDIAIVRAAFGVAETGSIALTERDIGINTLVYLAQHLIVLLDPADIVINIHHAYHRPEFRENGYCVLHTGPSATADIEGVLIHGAQGVRSLSILPLPRSSSLRCDATDRSI